MTKFVVVSGPQVIVMSDGKIAVAVVGENGRSILFPILLRGVTQPQIGQTIEARRVTERGDPFPFYEMRMNPT